jgi:hypothetical protein
MLFMLFYCYNQCTSSGAPSSGIHVSLFRARGLKVKSTQTKAKGWLLATTIPKIYVNVSYHTWMPTWLLDCPVYIIYAPCFLNVCRNV